MLSTLRKAQAQHQPGLPSELKASLGSHSKTLSQANKNVTVSNAVMELLVSTKDTPAPPTAINPEEVRKIEDKRWHLS